LNLRASLRSLANSMCIRGGFENDGYTILIPQRKWVHEAISKKQKPETHIQSGSFVF
jgi:hypothetical protein